MTGRTGRLSNRKVTGWRISKCSKLHHPRGRQEFHASSIGPYSLVTQQPLGGKAQFGGQRFARNGSVGARGLRSGVTLHEMLTVKSTTLPGLPRCTRRSSARRRQGRAGNPAPNRFSTGDGQREMLFARAQRRTATIEGRRPTSRRRPS